MARSLDFNKIKHRIKSTSISSEEALKDINPIEWPKEVLSGERKVEITHVFIENGSFEFEAITDNLK